MAGYVQDRKRWETRLAQVKDNLARVDRKIAGEEERSKGLRSRRAALVEDEANYLRALGREAEIKPATEGRA